MTEITYTRQGDYNLPEPSAAPGGAGSPWEIRIASEEVPQGAPQDNVHQPVDQRQAERPSGGDPADGPAPDGADRGADGQGSGRDGGTESQRPDEMGGSDEQPAERGGGNGAGRTDLQLTTQEPERKKAQVANGSLRFWMKSRSWPSSPTRTMT